LRKGRFNWNRFNIIFLNFIIIFFIIVLFSCRSSDNSKETPKNIVFISLDTLRADHLSCYGYERATSPNMDMWAKKGVLFKKVISQSQITAPSHMTMFTSLFPSVHGVSMGLTIESVSTLPLQFITLPQILQNQGLKTAAFTGGGQVAAEIGFGRGFHIYKENMGVITDENLEQVIDWVRKNKNKRFFLFLHTYQIHDPYLPPPPYNKKFGKEYKGWIIDNWKELKQLAKGDDYIKVSYYFWGGSKNWTPEGKIKIKNFCKEDIQHMIDLYDGEIAYTDHKIHQFIQELEKMNLLKDTMIIITSDHGEEFMEHKGFRHKDLYFEDVTVPLIMIWINHFPSGKIVREQIRLLDLMPTILDTLNISIPKFCQGQSLVPFIEGKRKFLPALSESPFGYRKALRTEMWCYIEDGKVRKQLFCRQDDPSEKRNLAYLKAHVLTELHNQIVSILDKNEVLKQSILKKEKPLIKKLSKETIEKLRALGYIH